MSRRLLRPARARLVRRAAVADAKLCGELLRYARNCDHEASGAVGDRAVAYRARATAFRDAAFHVAQHLGRGAGA